GPAAGDDGDPREHPRRGLCERGVGDKPNVRPVAKAAQHVRDMTDDAGRRECVVAPSPYSHGGSARARPRNEATRPSEIRSLPPAPPPDGPRVRAVATEPEHTRRQQLARRG